MAKDDLISKNDLLLSLAEYVNSNAYLNQTALDALLMVMRWVQETPAVDAVPVVHARWVKDAERNTYCSHCETYIPVVHCYREYQDYESEWDEEIEETEFCPNCGAKMDATGGEDDGQSN